MQTEILIAGSGGQGVLFGGTLIAQAAVEEQKQTTWFPSYGAEMRGGTANSGVIVSEEEIGSPVVANPSVLIALNELSLKRYITRAKPGATLVVNSSLIHDTINAPGMTVISIPATDIAHTEIGDVRAANLVAIGAYLRRSGILKLESAQRACEILFAEKPKLIALNQKALALGYAYKG